MRIEMFETLEHHGVKGMKWGVRKEYRRVGRNKSKQSANNKQISLSTPGISVNKNGAISINKGVSLQRLTRDGTKTLGKVSYASINDYDNAKYIKEIGGKGIFGGGRDTILQIKAKEPLKSPSKDEATLLLSRLITEDKDFRENLTAWYGTPITKKEISNIAKDPLGKDAKNWYFLFNQSLAFSEEFTPGTKVTVPKFKESLLKNGYNMLRDENDYSSGLTKAPIILLDPANTVELVKAEQITDQLRKASKSKLKEYSKKGNSWIENNLFS